jgi:hypothetical protein
MHAHPVPLEPYSSDSGTAHPFMPTRLPIFAAVLWLNDKIVNILSIRSSPTSHQSNGHHPLTHQIKDLSDEADSIEEGTRVTYAVNYDSENGTSLRKQTTERVTIRRKLD